MKIIIFFLLLFSVNSFSQKDTVTTHVENPGSIAIYNGELYVSETSLGKINKYDLSIINPTPESFLTNLGSPRHLYIEGGNLYYFVHNSGVYSIYKVDLTQTDTQPELVVGNLDYFIRDFLVTGDRLFYIEYNFNNELTYIKSLDLSISNSAPIEIGINDFATNLEMKGNYLYYSEYLSYVIRRIDLTLPNFFAETVVNWVYGPVGMAFNGNDLYFYEVDSCRLSKLDVTIVDPSNPIISMIDSGFYGFDIHVYEDDIYAVVSEPTNMVIRYNNIATSVVEYPKNKVDFIVYPSPSKEFLFLKNCDFQLDCTVIDLGGKVLIDSAISENQGIYIGNLSPGIYYLIVNDKLIPFVKI